MANSVEVRSPFVDHRLIEYVLDSSYSNFNFLIQENNERLSFI